MSKLTKEELSDVMTSIYLLQALSISGPSKIANYGDIQGVQRQAWRMLDMLKDRCTEDLAKRREYSQRPEVKERARKHQREYMREYNQDPERREKNAARSRAWCAANRERALAKAKEDHIKRNQRECAKAGYERRKQNDPEGL